VFTPHRAFVSAKDYNVDAALAAVEERMPIYITQGRYTRDAVKGMIIKPEDRADQVSRLLSKAGGRLIGYYLTFGEYDFMSVAEAPSDTQMAAVLLAAAGSGGVTDLRTTVAMTSVEAKGAFAAASDLVPGFKSAGGT
jgi:uncharacterized protein with GYD domain